MPWVMLGIDSSDDFISVGLAGRSGVIISKSSAPEMRNKNMIHSFTNDILAMSNVNIKDLQGVAVAIGPGSFTGLRVGLATAKGICWSLNLPLLGVSSLLAAAHCAQTPNGNFVAIKDAKRNEFYFAGFMTNGLDIRQIIPDSVGPAADILELQRNGFSVIGPGVDEMRRYSPNPTGMAEGYNRDQLGGAVASLGIALLSRGETLNLETSTPNYIRTPKPKEWKAK